MEIKRHLAFRADAHPELVHYLNMTFTPFRRGEIISTLDLYESNFRWPAISEYLRAHDMHAQAQTVFTEEELSGAAWLRIRSNWHWSYPQPEADRGYEAVTYDRARLCPTCGSGLQQNAPFQLKTAPKWGRRHFLMLNWVYDELFTDDAAKAALTDVAGLSFREAVNKKGVPLPGVHQLIIDHILPPALLPDDQTIRKEYTCPGCGVTKYITSGAGMLRFRAEALEDAPEIVKTAEVFGDGRLCCRDILIRRSVYRLLREQKLEGGLVFEPIELI